METSGELRGHETCGQNRGSRQGATQTAGPRKEVGGWRPERIGKVQEVADEMEEKKVKCGIPKRLRKMKGLRGVGQSRWEHEGIWKVKGKPSVTDWGPNPMKPEGRCSVTLLPATLALSRQPAPSAAHRGDTNLYTIWLSSM